MTSSTLPRHIAIIMDGNGRWATQRSLPRIAGHKAGVNAVRRVVSYCAKKEIEVLTLFAFSSENWRRPITEVNFLMGLFINALEKEAKKLHEQNIQLRVIGDRSRFDSRLQKKIKEAEILTSHNTGLKLVIAANYGGQWDITEACKLISRKVQQGLLYSENITADLIQANLALADLPHPDLLVRSSGEQRISNFLLWQLAYAELYFSPTLWPDFNDEELDLALDFYSQRQRRFGHTSEQLTVGEHA